MVSSKLSIFSFAEDDDVLALTVLAVIEDGVAVLLDVIDEKFALSLLAAIEIDVDEVLAVLG